MLPALPKVLAVALNQAAAHDCSHQPPAPQAISTLLRGEAFLRVHLVGANVEAAGLTSDMLGIMITPGFLPTFQRGRCNILEAVRQDYVHDVEQPATSPSVLVYEFGNKQAEQFLMIENHLDREVESTRLALRQFADLISSREILESAMTFSLTVMTPRTNLTMNRLPVVSTIFLPLTLLSGVYGMNVNAMPEIEWVHGHAFFWVISALITVSLTILLHRMRLL